jgi:hypothetical protein
MKCCNLAPSLSLFPNGTETLTSEVNDDDADMVEDPRP